MLHLEDKKTVCGIAWSLNLEKLNKIIQTTIFKKIIPKIFANGGKMYTLFNFVQTWILQKCNTLWKIRYCYIFTCLNIFQSESWTFFPTTQTLGWRWDDVKKANPIHNVEDKKDAGEKDKEHQIHLGCSQMFIVNFRWSVCSNLYFSYRTHWYYENCLNSVSGNFCNGVDLI